MKDYTIQEFVEKLLIPDLKTMIDLQLHYYAFSVICQASELLGGVFDHKETSDFGMSDKRFEKALEELFKNDLYRAWKGLFFEFLRGPLVHQMRPGEKFVLASVAKDNIDPKNHLQKDEHGRVILIIEPFFADFIEAYDRFKRVLATRTDLDHSKTNKPFISVSEVKAPVTNRKWDAITKAEIAIPQQVTGQYIPPRNESD